MRCGLFLLLSTGALLGGVSEGKPFSSPPLGLSSELHKTIPRGGVKQRNKSNKFVVADEVLLKNNNENSSGSGVITANLVPEVLAGMTVALASIPSSIAFASIAGVDPMVGVWSSVILGSISSFAGMRAGLIAGSAGVVVVPLATVISSYGPQYMAPTVILACLMEFIFSFAKGGKLINYVSDPVMSGFLNGLGCLLLKSQFKVFMSPASSDGVLSLLPKPELMATAGVTALTGALSLLLPMILPGNAWPTSLMAIAAATVAAQVFDLPVQFLTVGDNSSSDNSWYSLLPKFVGLPTSGEASVLSTKTLKLVAPAAFSIAVISLLETLLAVKVVDDADGTSAARKEQKKNAGGTYNVTAENNALDKSCMSMALGNTVSALFGGFGGCGLIPQTLLNIQSGGRGTISVLSYAFIMAVSILFSSSLIKMVPTSTLAGVMILVALRTIQWKPTAHALNGALNSMKSTRTNEKGSNNSDALASFVALAASSFVCYNVDMGSGIILGVLLDKMLPTVFDRFV